MSDPDTASPRPIGHCRHCRKFKPLQEAEWCGECARDGIEAQNGLNDTWEGDPYYAPKV